MSKKRKNAQRASQPDQPKSAQPAQPARPTAPPQSVPAAPAASGRSGLMWVLAIVPIVVLAGVGIWLLSRSATPSALPSVTAQAFTAIAPTPTFQKFAGQIGGVTSCRQQSKFSAQLGFGRNTVLSTAERTVKGLIIVEPSRDQNTPPRTYQHPSWTMGGYLGPSAIDRDGNIYVAPAPRVNLIDNPPERANIIYKVDTNTGVMSEFINLPFAQSPSLNNPYGILGMAYDCDTNSLYASSVAGSTREAEVGRLFHIDLNTGKIVDQRDDNDLMGVGVFNGSQGKRLYFGRTRTQDVQSIELDAQGRFQGEFRDEFSLADLGPDGNDKARKISFDRVNDMVINGTKFNYNLAPPVAQILPAAYRFRYDSAGDRWTFVETTTGPGAVTQ